MAWLLMLIEGACLLLLGVMGQKGYAAGSGRSLLANALVALPEGLLGAALALGIWHAAGLKVRCVTTTGPIVLRRIAVLPAGLVASVFLFCLWLVFDLITVPRSSALWFLVLGFAGMAATVTLMIALYPLWPAKLRLTLDGGEMVLLRGSLLVGLFAAVYEGIILPVMWLVFHLPLPPAPLHLVTGMVAGFVGGLTATWLLNLVYPHLLPWLDLAAAAPEWAVPAGKRHGGALEAGVDGEWLGQPARAHRRRGAADEDPGTGSAPQRR
jgi:hypothetical protein